MNFLDIAKEIKQQLLNREEFQFYIVNNTLGKNLILLIGNENKAQELKTSLKQNYADFIEDIYIASSEDDSSYLFKEIKKIGIKNDIVHRNSSYKSWLRNSGMIFNNKNSKIIAGYSFKGGMGRSSTIAYLASLLYYAGKKIVILDCDFEAPGISAMFFEKEKRKEKNGIVDFLIDSNLKEIDRIDNYFIQDKVSNSGGNLYLFPSGIDFQSNEYLNKISKIDFNSELYSVNFVKLLDKIQEVIKPDIIFIDLRAGINESNGFVLNEIANKNLLFFNSEDQNIDGMNVVLNKISPENSFLVNSLIRFNNHEIRELKEKEFKEIIKNYFGDYEVLNLPYKIEFLESLKQFKEFVSSQFAIKNNGNDYYFLEEFIDKLELDKKESLPVKISGIIRKNLLKKLKDEFDKVTGGSKFEKEEDLKYFYFKEDLVKIVNEQIFLILGAKGSGKSSLFEIFIKNYTEILNKLNNNSNTYIEGFSKKIMSELTAEQFEKLVEIAKTDAQIYERFWKYLTVFQIEEYLKRKAKVFESYSDIYSKLKDLDFSISIDSKLKDLNREFYDKDICYTLVYDELDVAFNKRRDEIISALISFWRNNTYKYVNLRSKIFLRKDIFNSLTKLENKTHLEINSYNLNWKKKEILSLILKIIVCSLTEEELDSLDLTSIVFKKYKDKIELVEDEDKIVEAVHKIFGKKLNEARKNITTMDNWIIQELSDGNGDITPRSVYKFMSSAIQNQLLKEKEKSEPSLLFHNFNDYRREVLKDCSEARIIEYKEEYKTHERFIGYIKEINYGKFTLEDYSKIVKTKSKAKENLQELEKSGFLINKGQQYEVAKIYFEALGIKKSKQGAKVKEKE